MRIDLAGRDVTAQVECSNRYLKVYVVKTWNNCKSLEKDFGKSRRVFMVARYIKL